MEKQYGSVPNNSVHTVQPNKLNPNLFIPQTHDRIFLLITLVPSHINHLPTLPIFPDPSPYNLLKSSQILTRLAKVHRILYKEVPPPSPPPKNVKNAIYLNCKLHPPHLQTCLIQEIWLYTVKTLKIGTPRLTTIFVVNIKQFDFTMQKCPQNM